jgi:hypothetical protein
MTKNTVLEGSLMTTGKKFVLEYGCEEWQDSSEFDQLQDVYDYVKTNDFTMGAYPATYIFITLDDDVIDTIRCD